MHTENGGIMKKVAIMFNEKNGMYEAYVYSFWLLIFGPFFSGFISLSASEEKLIEKLHREIYGKTVFVRIVKV